MLDTPAKTIPDSAFDIGIFWRRKWTLALCVIVSATAAVAYLQLAPGIYEAEAKLLVAKEGFSHEPQGERGEERRRFLATQAEVLASPVTVRHALERAPLTNMPATTVDEQVVVCSKGLSVAAMPNSDVLSIRFRSYSASDTTKMIHALIEDFRVQQRQHEISSHQSRQDVYAERERALRMELDALRSEFAKLRNGGPLMSRTKDVYSVQIRRLDQLDANLTQTRSKRNDVESRLDAFLLTHGLKRSEVQLATAKNEGNAGEEPVRQVVFKPESDSATPPHGNLAEIEQSRALAQAKVLSLSQHLLQKHPDLVAAKQELAWWERISFERKRLLAREMEAEIAGLKATETALERENAAEQEKVKQIDQSLAREEHLQTQINELSRTHQLAVAQLSDVRLTDAAIAEGQRSVRIQLLQEPEATIAKVWPKKGPFLALSCALGLIAGAAVALLTESKEKSRLTITKVVRAEPNLVSH